MPSRTRTALRLVSIGLVAASLSMSSACSKQNDSKEASMTDANTARNDMQEFVRDTMTSSGISWKSENGDPSPDECALENGSSGVSFSWNQNAEGVDDPETLVKQVGARWKDQGYGVTHRQGSMNPNGTLYQVIAVGPAVHSISVNASTRRVSIGVDSKCGTGDIDEYLDQLIDPSFRD